MTINTDIISAGGEMAGFQNYNEDTVTVSVSSFSLPSFSVVKITDFITISRDDTIVRWKFKVAPLQTGYYQVQGYTYVSVQGLPWSILGYATFQPGQTILNYEIVSNSGSSQTIPALDLVADIRLFKAPFGSIGS